MGAFDAEPEKLQTTTKPTFSHIDDTSD